MAATAIPRTIVKLSLNGMRLPLSIAERVGRYSGVDIAGTPAVAVYDAVEAEAKKALGRLLGDEQLVGEGERQARAARHRNGSERLSAQADRLRERAEEKLDDRVEQAEESREQIRQRTEERRAEIQREEEQARREARQRARKREEAVRQAAKTREKAVEAKERQAELARVQAESEALEKEQEAVQAEKVVTAIDEHLEGRRSTRTSNS